MLFFWQDDEKGHPARPQGLWHAERTTIREHDKGLRTPLVDIFIVLPARVEPD